MQSVNTQRAYIVAKAAGFAVRKKHDEKLTKKKERKKKTILVFTTWPRQNKSVKKQSTTARKMSDARILQIFLILDV